MRLLLVLLVGLSASSCVAARVWHLHAFPECADKMPIEILIDPGCPPAGVCGYSCLPDRWRDRAGVS